MARDSRAPIDYMNQKSSAEVAARRLRELGVDESRIIVLPVPDMNYIRPILPP